MENGLDPARGVEVAKFKLATKLEDMDAHKGGARGEPHSLFLEDTRT